MGWDHRRTSDRHLGRILQLQAEQNGNTVFLITDNQRITFAEADDITNRLAAGLNQLGIGKGDRIAFFMSNLPEMVLMCLALNKLGAVWVPACSDFKGEWLQDTLQRSRAKFVMTDAAHAPRVIDILETLPEQAFISLEDTIEGLAAESSYGQLLDNTPYQADYDSMSYGDTNAILWTSGTTGRSKGVMQAHNNWIRSTLMGTNLQYKTQPGDICYCALPLYNSGSWITCIVRSLIVGIGCVIEQKFSVANFLPRIKYFGATQTFAVGSMGVFLLGNPESDDDADNPLREACIAPMPPNLWQTFEQRFGVRLLRSGLGQSECLLVLNQEHTDVELPSYSLGYAPPDADVNLFDDDGNIVALGEAGEICFKANAPHVLFNGYFDAPEATESTYRNGWFLTGDMARKDPENGAFYFVDRKKDAVRFAGRNISTLEVESVVMRHPEVQMAAAFGIPNPQLESEDELKINIILKENSTISAEDICLFINQNAPHYFVPRYMEFVRDLPHTHTNKVQKFVLRTAGVTSKTWDLKQSDFKIEK